MAMNNTFDNLVVTPTIDNKFKLVNKFYISGIFIRKGYKTNGANIPRILWIIVPPFKPKYLPAIIVHDYLCDIEQYKKADKVFEETLLEIEDSFITKSMIKCVKFYHKIRYGV